MSEISNMEYIYDNEIDENSPRAPQPEKIKISLKEHQLACLFKAQQMEQTGSIKCRTQSFDDISLAEPSFENIDVTTNVGIIGDIVGYGKTLTALSLIASSDIKKINHNSIMNMSYSNSRNYSYISYSKKNKNIIDNNKIINSTLIVVPRGPVYIQWRKALENYTNLKFLAIENLTYIKKHLPDNTNSREEIITYFNQFDAVLIKNTTLDTLLSYYYYPNTCNDHMSHIQFIKRWKRIMIDEAHDIASSITLMYYEYLWLISGTYENIMCSLRSYRNILFHMREAINYDTIGLILVKCSKTFVKNSFKIPTPVEKYYLCKMPTHMNVIKNFICSSVLDKINANDITGAIRDLGGKLDTKENIIDLVSNDIKKDIHNKEKEKEYISSLEIPNETKVARIKSIDVDIKVKKEKLENLKQRILELNTKMCPICMYDIEHPIVLSCTHSYCASCIVKWISTNMNCPECRATIDTDNMISVVKEVQNTPESQESPILNKIDTLMEIIQKNPCGKYLIFSKYDNGFVKLMTKLIEKGITCSELKGNTSHMMNVLEKFKNGALKVILLNTNFAGSGIDISYATDVIIYHSMGLEKYQAIGRAQRVGRTDTLKIHYLCYEHEMASNKNN
jgi:hypothetical protein